MKRFKCETCGYIFDPNEGDPDGGIQGGTSFDSVPFNWVCPICGAGKEDFNPIDKN